VNAGSDNNRPEEKSKSPDVRKNLHWLIGGRTLRILDRGSVRMHWLVTLWGEVEVKRKFIFEFEGGAVEGPAGPLR
jgi:hypothetical protein